MVSNEQAEREIWELIEKHPTLEQARVLINRLPIASRMIVKQGFVDFLQSDGAFQLALQHTDTRLMGGYEDLRVSLSPVRPNVLECRITGLPEHVKVEMAEENRPPPYRSTLAGEQG